MPSFSYRAKDKTGNTVVGVVDADSETHAAGKIREMGHLPMSIGAYTPVSGSSAVVQSRSVVSRRVIDPIWSGVNIRHLLFFYRQLATLLAAGMSLSESLKSIETRTGGRMRRIIAEAYAGVMQGRHLSDTMSQHERVFGPLQISLVRTGEEGGLLEGMINRIADYLEHEIKVRRMLLKLLFYPMMIFVAIIFMPHVPTLVLSGFSPFARELWASVAQWVWIALALIVFLKLAMQFEACRFVWDIVKIQPPILGTMARKVAMSRFSQALAVLYSAGLEISAAVSISADACANVAICRRLKAAVPGIRAGTGLTECMARTGVVLPMVMDMLATGEKTGSMDLVLSKVAEYMDDEVEVTIHKTGIALFMLAILAAGYVVLQMVVGFYGGYFENTMKQGGA